MNSESTHNERQILCPFCNSTETEMFALFGQFLLASQYYCRNCRTVFDVVRWEDEAPPGDLSAPAHRESGIEPPVGNREHPRV